MALIFLTVWMLRYLFAGGNSAGNTLLVCTAFLLFPFQVLSTAGYIATIANYLYPFFTMLVIFSVIRYRLMMGKVSWWMYLALTISVIYTTNQDQYAISLIFFLAVLLIASIADHQLKPVRRLLVYTEILAAAGYAALYLAPGHRFRMNTYGTWIADYAQWTVGEKLYHGYTSTVAYLYYRQIPLLTAFFVVLFLVALSAFQNEKTQKGKWAVACTMLPLAVNLGLKGTGVDLLKPLPEVTLGMPELGSLAEGRNLLLLVLSILLTICVFLGIWLAVNTAWRRYVILVLLFMGAGSRMAMGFSETLYGSSYRTYSFLLFCIVIAVILLVQELRDHASERMTGFAWGVLFLQVIGQYSQSLRSLI